MKSGLFLIALIATLNSCSWYRNWQRSAIESENKTGRSAYVPREQYDQLLLKYEALSKKLGENSPAEGAVETVDAFEPPAQSASPVIEIKDDLNSQLSSFRRGQEIENSNSGEATKIFQQLETEAHPVIKPRAKLELGKILMEKNQYDIALQIFEDIIQKYAYSGAVLDALRYAKVCSDKLGLQNKKEQYSSMLSDVFETP